MKIVKILLSTLALGCALSAPLAFAQEGEKAPPQEKRERGPRGGMNPAERVKMMKEHLGLSDEQVTKITAIVEEGAKAVKALRDNKEISQEDRRSKMGELRKAEMEKIKAVLTPEQTKKAEEMFSRRGPGGPGGPGGERK